jgi:hypothetical protein
MTTLNEEVVGKYIKSLEWISDRKWTPPESDGTRAEIIQDWENWEEFIHASVEIHKLYRLFHPVRKT